MHLPKFTLSVSVLGLLCLMLPGSARADEFVYTYTGNPFTIFDGSYSCSGGVGECRLTITLTLSAPLGANLVDSTVTPISYTFSDGVNTLDGANSFLASGQPEFTTNSAGVITSWAVTATCDLGNLTCTNATGAESMGAGDSGPAPAAGQDSTDTPGDADAAFNNNDGGTWSTSVVRTPEPPGFILLGIGLLGLATLAARS